MLSVRNLLSPSNGEPIVSPTQDIVLGCYYMTSERDFEQDLLERHVADGVGQDLLVARGSPTRLRHRALVDFRRTIQVMTDRDGGEMKLIETTVGRAMFNQALPPALGKYYNDTMDRKTASQGCCRLLPVLQGSVRHREVVNEIKKVGFEFSTRGGMSIAVDDVTHVAERSQRLLAMAGTKPQTRSSASTSAVW